MTIQSMQRNMLLSSAGFNQPGTPEPLNVIREHKVKQISTALKVASGFGGCNAAIVFRKNPMG
jgi:3-oxoacyl-[acyl-carrier-protein] synthase-1